MIILSIEFFMLFSRVVVIREASGIYIVEMLVEICESFQKTKMGLLPASIGEQVSEILNLILLRSRISIPPSCLLGLSLRVIT